MRERELEKAELRVRVDHVPDEVKVRRRRRNLGGMRGCLAGRKIGEKMRESDRRKKEEVAAC